MYFKFAGIVNMEKKLMLWSDFINTWVQVENFEKPETYFKNQFAILLKSKIWSYLS